MTIALTGRRPVPRDRVAGLVAPLRSLLVCLLVAAVALSAAPLGAQIPKLRFGMGLQPTPAETKKAFELEQIYARAGSAS